MYISILSAERLEISSRSVLFQYRFKAVC
uniref:Uncharacterized protein n=1 Tax=Anguilla anguilla TaxID=7936 RepID=A0A0E9SWH0_ANGAN